jgi:hypothetical protein
MTYLDILSDMADSPDTLDPSSARSVLNGAKEEFAALEEQIRSRMPEGTAEKQTTQKPRSSYTMAEKAAFYQEQRAAGKDPNEAWSALPE